MSGLIKSTFSFFQIANCNMGHVRCRAVLLKCPFVMTAFCSNIRQQAIFQDDLTVVGAVDLCASTELICTNFEVLQI